MRMRLQKALAIAGIASRRAAEALIAQGVVTINDETVTRMGTTVDTDHDRIRVNGRPVEFTAPPLTLMLNKPAGYICSANDAQGRTVFELLRDIPQRLFTIGRLDKHSEGLLLLTNNGELAHRLSHPRHEHRKIYEVTVGGRVTPPMLAKLNGAMLIDGVPIQPARVIIVTQETGNHRTRLEFMLKEGRNRQIRKMCEQIGLRILQLRRTQVGQLKLGTLPAGHYRELTTGEWKRLNAPAQVVQPATEMNQA